MTTVRVASFNVRTSRGRDGRDRWWWRRRACAAAIRGLRADIVGLQEVRPGQLRFLRGALDGYLLSGAGRDRRGGGEHACVATVASWTVESSETRWLSPTPRVSGSRGWDAALPRIVTLVRLRRAGAVLGIANTHLDHHGAEARARGAELVARWLAAEAERPWVLTGDLNAGPSARPLRILAGAGFVDALADGADRDEGGGRVGGSGRASGGTVHGFTGARDRTRIDYVLCGPGVRPVRGWIDHARPGGRLPSDHWPVVADLEVPGCGANPRPG